MIKEIKNYQNTLLFFADIIYNSDISEQTKMQVLNLFKKTNESLENERQFYLAARKCKNLIERNGNKIIITIPDVKKRNINVHTVAAYEFAQGVEKRYKTVVKKAKKLKVVPLKRI